MFPHSNSWPYQIILRYYCNQLLTRPLKIEIMFKLNFLNHLPDASSKMSEKPDQLRLNLEILRSNKQIEAWNKSKNNNKNKNYLEYVSIRHWNLELRELWLLNNWCLIWGEPTNVMIDFWETNKSIRDLKVNVIVIPTETKLSCKSMHIKKMMGKHN